MAKRQARSVLLWNRINKCVQIFIYFSKPLRLLYSLIIYEIIVNFFSSLFTLLLLLSFFLYLKSVPIHVIVHVPGRRRKASQILTIGQLDPLVHKKLKPM